MYLFLVNHCLLLSVYSLGVVPALVEAHILKGQLCIARENPTLQFVAHDICDKLVDLSVIKRLQVVRGLFEDVMGPLICLIDDSSEQISNSLVVADE